MKKVLNFSVSLCIIFLLGCKQDELTGTKNEVNTNGVPTNTAHISVHDIKGYLPEGYTSRASAIYRDESGKEKILKTVFIEGQKERVEYDRIYTYDNFVVRLFCEEDPNFRIEIDGHGLYTQSGEVQKVIGAILMPMNPHGSSSVSVIFKDGKPLVSIFDNFQETATINGRPFEKVYFSNSSLTQYNSYSEIDFNFKEGIVAFRDIDDKLWVFDRFEE